MKKCIISFLLSMCMACSLLPGKAWAAEVDPVPKQTVEQQPDVTSTSGGNQEPTNEDPSNGEENKKANDTDGGKNDSGSTGGTQQLKNTQDGQSDDGSQKDGTLKSNANQQPSDGSQSEVNQESIESSKAVVENNNDPTTVTVSDGKAYVESTKQEYESLDAAMKAAAQSDTIYLGTGTYCGNSANPTVKGNGARKSLTFVGAGTDKTTWQIRALDKPAVGPDGPCDYSFEGSDSITFKNMTIVGSVYSDGSTVKAENLQGLVRIQNITLENCIFNGRADYWGYTSTTFKNVTFNAPGTDASGVAGVSNTNYSLWTYTGNTYTFKGCTFNSTGKTINVYRHNAEQFQNDVTINYENCTVNNSAHKKQALKINDSTAGRYKYIINISGANEVNGIEPNSITCSRLFGFDENSENAGNTIVNIENEKVWEGSKRVGSHNRDFTSGSYSNGNAEGTDNKYTDGYKDDAFTTTYSSWTWNEDKKQLARTVTKVCKYCGEKVVTTEYKDLDLDVSRSKTATALDSSNQSTVTLSLPSAEENLVSDVVFVLDGSSSAATKVVKDSLDLLDELKKSVKDSGATVNVCVVKFKRRAYKSDWFDLSKDYEKIKKAMEKKYSGGTNLHAGLLAGKEALGDHTNVPASRKYLILISDGSTYLYSKDGDWSSDTPYTRSYYTKENYSGVAGGFNDQGLYNPSNGGSGYDERNVARPQNTSDVGAWQKYLADVEERNKTVNSEGKTGDDYDYRCNYDLNFNQGIWSEDFKSQPCEGRTANNRDMAFYYADQVWQEIKEARYNAYSIAEDDGSAGAGNADDSHCFMNYLNGGASLNFSDIKNDIFYAVCAGSTVEDKMGESFDFVPGSLVLMVGSEKLDSKVEGNITYFGAKDTKQEIGDGNYRFKVEYDSTDDKFTWTINENVSNFAPVQLSYKVKLVKPSTTPGTYSVDTNEYAKLTPKNSAGQIGTVLEFNKPKVTYTVSDSGSSSGGNGGSSTSTDTPAAEQAQTATQTVLGATRPAETVAAQPTETATEESAVLGATRDESAVLGQSRGAGTGDESHMAAWGGAAAGALALLALYFGIKNRKNRRF